MSDQGVEAASQVGANILEGLEADFVVQLSTDGVTAERLVELTGRLEAAVDVEAVVYGAYGSEREKLRDVIGRLREDEQAALA